MKKAPVSFYTIESNELNATETKFSSQAKKRKTSTKLIGKNNLTGKSELLGKGK